jgi:hypothetical protein
MQYLYSNHQQNQHAADVVEVFPHHFTGSGEIDFARLGAEKKIVFLLIGDPKRCHFCKLAETAFFRAADKTDAESPDKFFFGIVHLNMDPWVSMDSEDMLNLVGPLVPNYDRDIKSMPIPALVVFVGGRLFPFTPLSFTFAKIYGMMRTMYKATILNLPLGKVFRMMDTNAKQGEYITQDEYKAIQDGYSLVLANAHEESRHAGDVPEWAQMGQIRNIGDSNFYRARNLQ